MGFHVDVKQRIEEELTRGEAARQTGFEGRARVCARRAAGAAIRAYLDSLGQSTTQLVSAYDLIAYLRDLPGIEPEIRRVGDHLLAQVNEAFDLPVEADLLAEARWLAQILESKIDAENTDRQEREG